MTNNFGFLSIVFAVICFSFWPIVFFFYPETSHRTLEDMDQIFIQNPSWLVYGKQELTQRNRPESLVEAERMRVSDTSTPPQDREKGGAAANTLAI
jgi:hypothetical protein